MPDGSTLGMDTVTVKMLNWGKNIIFGKEGGIGIMWMRWGEGVW